MQPAAGWLTYFFAFVILVSAYFRYSALDGGDTYKCGALLTTGQWMDPPQAGSSQAPYRNWQPNGCRMNNYNKAAIRSCLGKSGTNGGLFIGDSRARYAFWALARKIDSTIANEEERKVSKHADISIEISGVKLDFIWDPYLNSTALTSSLAAFRIGEGEHALVDDAKSIKPFVVVGGGLWYAAMDSRDAIEQFKSAVDRITEPFHDADGTVNEFDAKGRARPVFMGVQPPYYSILDEAHQIITAPKVDAMNDYLLEVSHVNNIDLMTSIVKQVEGESEVAFEPSGIHVSDRVAEKQADLLLNFRCNGATDGYPYDSTCCIDYPFPFVAVILLGTGFIIAMAVLWGSIEAWIYNGTENKYAGGLQKWMPLLSGITVMWACLLYCFLADRTHLFNKVQKYFNGWDFFLICAGIAVAGVLTVKASPINLKPNQEKPEKPDQPFLSRDQTDEWKGWMQLAILGYHYTGGSSVLPIYKIIRLLVASYLFMSGYGHAAYFYQKSDFSIKRITGVLVRLNLLSVLLPWAMDTDYLFYYFAPLVTYWYAIIYLTMWIKSDWNQRLPLFLLKIGVMCALTTAFHTQPQLLTPIFTVVNAIFASKWDAKEWMFRCALDQFIVYVGMIVAVLYIRASKPPPPPPPPADGIPTAPAHTLPGRSPHLKTYGSFAASILALVVYGYASSYGTTKGQSNTIHPYISPLPILAFVQLRNSTRILRLHYSGAFAWIGKISLETFILQYHIWLAADTKGVLSLGLFGGSFSGIRTGLIGGGMSFAKWVDCLLIGALFILVSSKVSAATGVITGAVMKALF